MLCTCCADGMHTHMHCTCATMAKDMLKAVRIWWREIRGRSEGDVALQGALLHPLTTLPCHTPYYTPYYTPYLVDGDVTLEGAVTQEHSRLGTLQVRLRAGGREQSEGEGGPVCVWLATRLTEEGMRRGGCEVVGGGGRWRWRWRWRCACGQHLKRTCARLGACRSDVRRGAEAPDMGQHILCGARVGRPPARGVARGERASRGGAGEATRPVHSSCPWAGRGWRGAGARATFVRGRGGGAGARVGRVRAVVEVTGCGGGCEICEVLIFN